MSSSPAAWHPDPTGQHDHRWWDGERWTEHVADGGVAGVDPLDAAATTTDTTQDAAAATAPDVASDAGGEAATTADGTQPLTPETGHAGGDAPASDAGGWAGAGGAAGAAGATGAAGSDWQAPTQPTQPAQPAGWQQPAGSQPWPQPAPAWQASGATPAAPAAGGGRNGLSLAAMITGLLSLPLLFACGLGALTGLVAIVLGFIGLSSAKKNGQTGRGMAITGIISGFVALVIVIGLFTAFGGIGTSYADCLARTGNEAFCQQQLENSLLRRFGM